MMTKRYKLLVTFILLTLAHWSMAANPLIPAPPQLAATGYLLVDAHSGEVLIQNNADQPLPPASLTKLMTSYIAAVELDKGNIKLDDQVRVSIKAWQAPGSRMFIKEGTFVALEDLLRGIIIQSGNDASIAVAEHIAGSEEAFADLMNKHAARLGMNNTNFLNATGLPETDHYTTASDLAKLARSIIMDHPDHYAMYAEQYFTYNQIRQPNRNKLLWRDRSVDGLKTGHTEEAGYCLVASAERNGMRLISVVMGASSEEARAEESQKLLTYGFRYYETHKLYSANEMLNQPRVWGGVVDSVKLGVANDLYVTIPRGQKEALAASLDVDTVIEAPISSADQFGVVKVKLGEQTLTQTPLIALESVKEGGFFKRIWDQIVLFFVQLIG
ncbi:MAG: D-alanyl-D-alanine carboxypeptidase [Pseudomonadales bacterium]|nr:D-alanyl-D-alanine carboxypeptidase [Pseudomonadales bacterium]